MNPCRGSRFDSNPYTVDVYHIQYNTTQYSYLHLQRAHSQPLGPNLNKCSMAKFVIQWQPVIDMSLRAARSAARCKLATHQYVSSIHDVECRPSTSSQLAASLMTRQATTGNVAMKYAKLRKLRPMLIRWNMGIARGGPNPRINFYQGWYMCTLCTARSVTQIVHDNFRRVFRSKAQMNTRSCNSIGLDNRVNRQSLTGDRQSHILATPTETTRTKMQWWW